MPTTSDTIVFAGTTATISLDGIDLGDTQDGIELEVNTELREIPSDQSLSPVDVVIIGRTATVRCNLLEATLDNIRAAWNLPTTDLVSDSLNITFNQAGPKQLVITHKGPNNKTRTWTFPRAVAVSAGAQRIARENETLVPVEFRILGDSTTGQIGTAVDV